MIIGNREFNTELKTYVMGILNLTPDSFSDGGQFFSEDPARMLDIALAQTERMIEEGADIIDIGGESTRPGYTPISDEEEIERVLPVIDAVKARFDIPVSLDTYKSAVAREGLAHGVDLINDIWGLKADPLMASVIAEYDVPCCLMHNRKEPVARASKDGGETSRAAAGSDPAWEEEVVNIWLKEIAESIRLAAAGGIGREQIILDPGIGFGKNYKQNLIAIHHLDRLVALGYPVLLGTSRKSVIANALAEPTRTLDCASCNACDTPSENCAGCDAPAATGGAPAEKTAPAAQSGAPADKAAPAAPGGTPSVPMEDRVVATAVTTAFAVQAGCAFVRVHDVKENVQAIRMTRAVLED